MTFFEIWYWVGVLGEIVIRAPLQKTWKTAEKRDQRISPMERLLLGLLLVGMFLLPLIYTATPWLDFANYHLPAWLGWLGVGLLAVAVWLFALAHRDLGSNWSPSLEIFEHHTMITSGVYNYIRHPMYASQWVWVVAQILLLQNWLAGPVDLLFFIPFYILRTRAEEKMMLDTFGQQYRDYRQKTGAVIPKF